MRRLCIALILALGLGGCSPETRDFAPAGLSVGCTAHEVEFFGSVHFLELQFPVATGWVVPQLCEQNFGKRQLWLHGQFGKYPVDCWWNIPADACDTLNGG